MTHVRDQSARACAARRGRALATTHTHHYVEHVLLTKTIHNYIYWTIQFIKTFIFTRLFKLSTWLAVEPTIMISRIMKSLEVGILRFVEGEGPRNVTNITFETIIATMVTGKMKSLRVDFYWYW